MCISFQTYIYIYIYLRVLYLYLLSIYPCIDVLLVVVFYMYIPLFILAQFRALESTVSAISLKSADLMLQSCLFDTGSGAGGVPG